MNTKNAIPENNLLSRMDKERVLTLPLLQFPSDDNSKAVLRDSRIEKDVQAAAKALRQAAGVEKMRNSPKHAMIAHVKTSIRVKGSADVRKDVIGHDLRAHDAKAKIIGGKERRSLELAQSREKKSEQLAELDMRQSREFDNILGSRTSIWGIQHFRSKGKKVTYFGHDRSHEIGWFLFISSVSLLFFVCL